MLQGLDRDGTIILGQPGSLRRAPYLSGAL